MSNRMSYQRKTHQEDKNGNRLNDEKFVDKIYYETLTRDNYSSRMLDAKRRKKLEPDYD